MLPICPRHVSLVLLLVAFISAAFARQPNDLSTRPYRIRGLSRSSYYHSGSSMRISRELGVGHDDDGKIKNSKGSDGGKGNNAPKTPKSGTDVSIDEDEAQPDSEDLPDGSDHKSKDGGPGKEQGSPKSKTKGAGKDKGTEHFEKGKCRLVF
jgi:hypothetical protein